MRNFAAPQRSEAASLKLRSGPPNAGPVFALGPLQPFALVREIPEDLDPPTQGTRTRKPRRKIWELSAFLHCSVIGTCLSCSELRHILGKLGLAGTDASDHLLHGDGVRLAGAQGGASKLLNKALD